MGTLNKVQLGEAAHMFIAYCPLNSGPELNTFPL